MFENKPKSSLNIAVVGLASLFPQSNNLQELWNNIITGRDLLRDVPPEHWLIEDYYDPNPQAEDKTYCKRGAFLDPIPFDPFEFRIPPSIVSSTDTAQLLTLLATQKLLQDICQNPNYQHLDLSRTSIILGTTGAQELILSSASRLEKPIWLEAMRRHHIPEDEAQKLCETIASLYTPWTESTFPGLLGNVIAGRSANYFNIGGTNCVVDAACASSFSALSMGINELILGQSDLVLTGGVDTMQHISMFLCFSKTPALSRTGDCRPFAENADGTMLGEGIGMLALKRLADAERDKNPIYAVIQGLGSSSDGKGKSVHVPVPEGQAVAIRRAYNQAGYSPKQVELIEAHGTATFAGDVAEAAGLRLVFEQENKDFKKPWCALGSIKSQIGHTKGTAGAAGLIKAVLALHHKVLPPTIKVNKPNPKLKLEESAFYLNTETRPWISAENHPRRAGVSSFGFGGSNFHVTLEEYQGPGKKPALTRIFPSELLLLSSQNKAGLLAECQKLLEKSKIFKHTALAYQTQQQDFSQSHKARLALVVTADNYSQQIEKAIHILQEKNQHSSEGIFLNLNEQNKLKGKLAFLFPGQGSQYTNMGADITNGFAAARSIWEQTADSSFDPNITLSSIVFPIPAFDADAKNQQKNLLAKTEWCQPALATTSMAMVNLLTEMNIHSDCFAGHSFGEITALAAAGWCDFPTLLRVARKRGELMAEAAHQSPGAMLAILHSTTDVLALLKEESFKSQQLTIANYNSPNQVVVSGLEPAILQLEQQLKHQGWSYQRLPVATAFHSPIVASACSPFKNWLTEQDLNYLNHSVYSNLTAKPYENHPTAICFQLANQLIQPVHFAQQIETMYQDGVRIFVEVGPGSVLKKLVEQCLHLKKDYLAISLDEKGQNGINQFWQGIAQLFVNNIEINFKPLWQDYLPLASTQLENNLSKTTIMIQGCNYGKNYPPPEGSSGKTKPTLLEPTSISTLTSASQQRIAKEETDMNNLKSNSINNNEPASSNSQGNVENNVSTTSYSPHPNSISHDSMINFEYQIVQAHTAYQRAMADSHIAFLQTAERILSLLSHHPMPTSNYVQTHAQPVASVPMTTAPKSPTIEINSAPSTKPSTPIIPPGPAMVSTPPPAPSAMVSNMPIPPISSSMPPPAPTAHNAPSVPQTPASTIETQQNIIEPLSKTITNPIPSIPSSSTTMDNTSASSQNNSSVDQQILNIVADKTGYPLEMLNLQMDMEADLGIDSIKRVEILSAAQQEIPNLPAIDAMEMASLKTLEEISNYLKKKISN